GAVLEEPKTHPSLESLGALGLEHVGRLEARRQTWLATLGRRVASAQELGAGIGLNREIGQRLDTRLTIRDASLAVRQPGLVADRLGELPGRAALGEPAAQVAAPKGRGAIVAHRRAQVQLVLDVESPLPEPPGIVDHLLSVDRDVRR